MEARLSPCGEGAKVFSRRAQDDNLIDYSEERAYYLPELMLTLYLSESYAKKDLLLVRLRPSAANAIIGTELILLTLPPGTSSLRADPTLLLPSQADAEPHYLAALRSPRGGSGSDRRDKALSMVMKEGEMPGRQPLAQPGDSTESESQSTGIALHSKIPQRKQAASQSAHSILSQFFSFYDRSKGNGPTRNGPIREKGQDMVLRSEQGMLSRRVMQIVIYLNS
uniref:Uncharacterized protein n=1 Tax=Solanum lycopersicum TaxID=4081 RepID=A0A494G919_SOLLC